MIHAAVTLYTRLAISSGVFGKTKPQHFVAAFIHFGIFLNLCMLLKTRE